MRMPQSYFNSRQLSRIDRLPAGRHNALHTLRATTGHIGRLCS